MAEEPKNILQNNQDLEQQKLMDYLRGKLDDAGQHEVEKHLVDDEFLSDAAEGLQQLKGQQQTDLMVYELNKKLKKQLGISGRKKAGTFFSNQNIVYFSVFLIILLAIISYLVIRKL